MNRENREKLAQLRRPSTLFTGHDSVDVDMEAAMRTARKSHVYTQLAAAQGAAAAESALPALLDETAETFRAELWENNKFFGDLSGAHAAAHRPAAAAAAARAPQRQLNEGHIPKLLELKVEAQVPTPLEKSLYLATHPTLHQGSYRVSRSCS